MGKDAEAEGNQGGKLKAERSEKARWQRRRERGGRGGLEGAGRGACY